LKIDSIISEPKEYKEFLERWHFTQSERVQLSRLLQQWNLRLPNDEITKHVIENTTGKSVLNVLREKINASEFVIHD
jgi:hypothetical protein